MAKPAHITPDDVKKYQTATSRRNSSLSTHFTAKQLSATLQIAESTIYEWVHLGYIPHIRRGRCVRFDIAAVQTWLQEHTKPGRTRRVPGVEV